MKGIALDLAEMTGFNSGDTFASNKADLLAAIEAIATTDAARSPEGQEQLERLINAITGPQTANTKRTCSEVKKGRMN